MKVENIFFFTYLHIITAPIDKYKIFAKIWDTTLWKWLIFRTFWISNHIEEIVTFEKGFVYFTWKIATIIFIITTENKVNPKNPYCHSSVEILVIAAVKINKIIITIKAVNSLGKALNLWPITAFNSRNVTLGTMDAMLRWEAHCFCNSVISMSSPSPNGTVTLRNLYFQYASTKQN